MITMDEFVSFISEYSLFVSKFTNDNFKSFEISSGELHCENVTVDIVSFSFALNPNEFVVFEHLKILFSPNNTTSTSGNVIPTLFGPEYVPCSIVMDKVGCGFALNTLIASCIVLQGN